MIEQGWPLPPVSLAHPVSAVHEISHDPSLSVTVPLSDGRVFRGIDVQRAYAEAAAAFVDDRYGDDADEDTRSVLGRWFEVLDALERDPMELADRLDWPAKLRLLEGFRSRDGLAWGAPRLAVDPMQLAGELDWVAKLRVLNGYRERDGLDWDSSRLQLIDLQYSDVRPEKGLYHRLVSRGAMTTLVTGEEVARAVNHPPEDTRAYFRGECLRRYGQSVAAASWDSVIFDVGRESLVRVPMLEPLRGTKAHVGELLEQNETAQSLIDALVGPR
jgi:proteasome accessory factor A